MAVTLLSDAELPLLLVGCLGICIVFRCILLLLLLAAVLSMFAFIFIFPFFILLVPPKLLV